MDEPGTPEDGRPLAPEEFARVDMRIGRIVAAEPFPEARSPAYRLRIDLGPLGVRASSAQITRLYQPEELVGRLIVAVVNFPPKRIAGFRSEVLVLGASDPTGAIALLSVDGEPELGSRVH